VALPTSPAIVRGVALVACLAIIVASCSLLPGLARGARSPALSPTKDYVNMTATDVYTFVLAAGTSFSVYPGAQVVLKIVQEATFDHTFNLSSQANTTIPTSDNTSQVESYFRAHHPIIEHDLGAVRGNTSYLNFTAPAVGTYEYVCVLHFASGMRGFMTSTKGTPPPPSTIPVTPVDLAIFGGVVVAIVALVVVLLRPGRLARQAREEEIARNSARRRRQDRS
jgi:plastocyanin